MPKKRGICPQGWHTVSDVAEIWGVSKDTVYREIREGRLKASVPRMRKNGMIVSDAEIRRYESEEFEEVAR